MVADGFARPGVIRQGPHLGSDLALAHATAQGLRCEFHGWCWGDDGGCVDAPGNITLLRYAGFVEGLPAW